jgi:hypothetical protein
MTNLKTGNRPEIRLKVWIENGKIAVQLTDARGHINEPIYLSQDAKIELWSSSAYGILSIQDTNDLIAYDVITSERLDYRYRT